MGRENIDKPNIIRKVYLVGPYVLYIFLSKVFAKRTGNTNKYKPVTMNPIDSRSKILLGRGCQRPITQKYSDKLILFKTSSL